jgi:hypothetical protein
MFFFTSTKIREIYFFNFSSHLLPAGDISISDGFLPSTQEFLWTPEEAISNHSARSIRFQETNLQSRFAPGDISSIIIEGNNNQTDLVAHEFIFKHAETHFFHFYLKRHGQNGKSNIYL